jgi:hypothetical protein
VSTFRLDSVFDTPGKNFHIFFFIENNFKNILGLMDLVATLPASSANAEQGFSIMKQAKNDWRTRLLSDKSQLSA